MNRLRSLLRDYYPQALVAFPNLAHRAAANVLRAAPTPPAAARLTLRRVVTLLKQAGRRNDAGLAENISSTLRAEALRQPAPVEHALVLQRQIVIWVPACLPVGSLTEGVADHVCGTWWRSGRQGSRRSRVDSRVGLPGWSRDGRWLFICVGCSVRRSGRTAGRLPRPPVIAGRRGCSGC